MAENKDKAAEQIADAANKTIDEISGLLEAIGQTIHDIFKGRNFIEVLALAAGGTLTMSLFTRQLSDLLKGTSGPEMLARQMIRDNYQRILEGYASDVGKAVKNLYIKLSEQLLMDEKSFDALIAQIKKKGCEFDQRSVESKKTRKWVSIGFISIFMLIGLIAGTETDALIAIGISLFVIAVLGLIGYFFYNRSSNNGTGNSEMIVPQEI